MEYTALYRRFRPMTFSEILGQEHITTTLRNQVVANRVGHAYLFTGSRGCGKTSAAKVLARAINCLNPKNGEPCNECSICKAAIDGSLTDIVEMDAASNNSVDDIREIKDEVNFLPTVAKYRVYIIDEVHMLSTGAFNALLKTLEEPPAHVKFILATTEPQKLPATILSRCQRFDFKKISNENIVLNLGNICKKCGIDYTEGALNLIAELSEGAMRDALSILERCAQDGENKIDEQKIRELVGIPEIQYVIDIIENILKNDYEKNLLVTQNLINSGKDISNILWEIIKTTRDLMLLKTTGKISNTYSKGNAARMAELVKETNNDKLFDIIYSLSKLENELKWTSQKNIIFQVGILKLCNGEEPQEEKINSTPKNKTIVNTAKEREKTSQNLYNKNKSENMAQVNNNAKKPEKNGESFWRDIIEKLKEEKMPMLYSNLLNSRGLIIDDMTFGIEFPNGLNSFERSIIEKPENMAELKKLVSIECKKDMRIKLIDDKKDEENSEGSQSTFNINIIN